jgi:hypothetical protein
MARIEMLDEYGNVTEICDATESPLAKEDDDEGAFCEDGENLQARLQCAGPVYRWTTADDMTFQACRYHIEHDDFSRFAKV